MQHKLFVALAGAASSVALHFELRAAEPPDAGIVRDCEVVLSRLSYDDPGTDDAEFLELRVEPPQAILLSECGVAALRLVGGGAGECNEYRTLDLAGVLSDARGFAVLCSADSLLHQDVVCDATTFGGQKIGNGWLQNGPDDGLELLAASATPLRGYAYAVSSGNCPSGADVVHLPPDTGPPKGEVDQVLVNCDGVFLAASLADSPLRSESCAVAVSDAGHPGPRVVPERAPPEPAAPTAVSDGGGFEGVSSDLGTVEGGAARLVSRRVRPAEDASVGTVNEPSTHVDRSVETQPPELGCAVRGVGRRASRGGAGLLVCLGLLLTRLLSGQQRFRQQRFRQQRSLRQ
jgi:hypothetical protein